MTYILDKTKIKAIIFDLDGVITRTAGVHAAAWEKMFNEYLDKRILQNKEGFLPIQLPEDYLKYIDGIPRYDGVKNFLESRNIYLPYGDPDDPPDRETICGLGNRKNKIFNQLIEEKGFEIFEDTVGQIKNWKKSGIRMAVISASKNCEAILKAAGLDHLFESRVDGVVSARLKLKGKPAPDIFLHAASELGVKPEEAVVVEDAIAGVKAGSKGNFACVIGVSRNGNASMLSENGADVVVKNMNEVELVG